MDRPVQTTDLKMDKQKHRQAQNLPENRVRRKRKCGKRLKKGGERIMC